MTQKLRVLYALIQVDRGVTAVELRDNTGLPERSLRTLLWELRKNGLIEVVGGVRGRYLYGITDVGRDEVIESGPVHPRVPPDSSAQAALLESMALNDARHERRTLRAYARWLAQEHSDLFAGDQASITERIEAAIDEFLAPEHDRLEKLLAVRRRRAQGDPSEGS